MEIQGEGKGLIVERKTGDSELDDAQAGRIIFDETANRLKYKGNVAKNTIPTLDDIAALRDLMYAVGDFKTTNMGKTKFFQNYSDTKWIALDGYGLYDAAEEPYLAADFTEILALGFGYTDTVDLGWGSKEYVFFPDMKHCALVGADFDGGTVEGNKGSGTPRAGGPSELEFLVSSSMRSTIDLGGGTIAYDKISIGNTHKPYLPYMDTYAPGEKATSDGKQPTIGGVGPLYRLLDDPAGAAESNLCVTAPTEILPLPVNHPENEVVRIKRNVMMPQSVGAYIYLKVRE
jgi:hypothetical protein